jgi:hypothetical protein
VLPKKEKIDKLILKFIWKYKGPGIAKTVLKKTKVIRLTFPYFKITTKLLGGA